MFNNLTYYEGAWSAFGIDADAGQGMGEYEVMVRNAICASISLSDYFGDGPGMILEKKISNDDVLMNGPTATNQIYLITFEGPSVTGTGGARHLVCSVSSPDGINLVYNKISYGAVDY